MKIAVLTSSFLPNVGGAQVFSYNISRWLEASGNTIRVYVPANDFRRLPPRFQDSVRPLPRGFYGLVERVQFLGLRRARRYLLREQRTEKYDAWLVVVTSPSGYVGACLRGKVPIALRASGEDIQKSPELAYGYRLNSALEAKIQRVIAAYDKVVALTESVRTDFLDLGAADRNIVTIPNGVDLDWFARSRDVAEIRTELQWPQDRLVVLTTGRNHRKKGFDLIPAIADRLRAHGLRFRWYVVGKGVNSIEDEVRARGLGEYVVPLGEVGVPDEPGVEWRFPDRKLVSMYQAADVYAFPSLLETFGMVQLEAMAAGTTVVSTDAPGCRDVVMHEENGLQARAGDVDSFAGQMIRVLEDANLRRSLADQGREFVQPYSWANVARQYETMFEELADDQKASHAAAQAGGPR